MRRSCCGRTRSSWSSDARMRPFEALVYSDAEAYTSFGKFNKPGTIHLPTEPTFERDVPTTVACALNHQQHACLGIIEVNSACNMDCPLCFSESGPGFSLTLEEVEQMLDDFVRTEGKPEVIQFSGGSLRFILNHRIRQGSQAA